MQYPIEDEIAQAFSTSLYSHLAQRESFGQAVQACRRELSEAEDADPRLIGMPMLYVSSEIPLLEEGNDA
jgi:hypothetical protein